MRELPSKWGNPVLNFIVIFGIHVFSLKGKMFKAVSWFYRHFAVLGGSLYLLDFIALYIPVGHTWFYRDGRVIGGAVPHQIIAIKSGAPGFPPNMQGDTFGERLLNYIEHHRTS